MRASVHKCLIRRLRARRNPQEEANTISFIGDLTRSERERKARVFPTGADGKISRREGRIIAGVRVYVEVVLINNLAVDALIVYAVMLARRRKVHKLRFLSAVALGAAVATAYPVLPEWACILVRVALAPVMCAIFDRYGKFSDYITSLALFCALTFALGGAVTGTSHLLGVDLGGYLILGVMAFAAVMLLFAVRCVVRSRGRTCRKICDATVSVDGADFAVEALCDTGNSLTDAVSGLPVIIVSERLACTVDGWHGAGRVRNIEGYVELVTVSGRASLPIVKVDGVCVRGKVTKAYAALSERNFDGYEVILQNTMF